MNAPAFHLSGHSALEGASLAAVKLCGVVWGRNEALVGSCRLAMIASLERLAEVGVNAPWLTWRLAGLLNEETWRADWTEESGELIQLLGELMVLDEALATSPAPSSRPETPPPPSGDGDELAAELSAARAATGDTLPPASGPREMAEMSCCGADTEPPGPGSVEWWDDQPAVRS